MFPHFRPLNRTKANIFFERKLQDITHFLKPLYIELPRTTILANKFPIRIKGIAYADVFISGFLLKNTLDPRIMSNKFAIRKTICKIVSI